MILDGRNRYRACLEAGVEPIFLPYQGDDPVAYVLSLNLHRRHLNESQRAMVAGRVATLQAGRPQENTAIAVIKQDKAAALLNVSIDSIQRARTVLDKGAPELEKAVMAKVVSVSAAADVAKVLQFKHLRGFGLGTGAHPSNHPFCVRPRHLDTPLDKKLEFYKKSRSRERIRAVLAGPALFRATARPRRCGSFSTMARRWLLSRLLSY
jgi:hypothetical protein